MATGNESIQPAVFFLNGPALMQSIPFPCYGTASVPHPSIASAVQSHRITHSRQPVIHMQP